MSFASDKDTIIETDYTRAHRGGTSGEDWSIVLWDDSVALEPSVHKTAALEPA